MEIDKAIRESDDERLKTKYKNAIFVIRRALALYSYVLLSFSTLLFTLIYMLLSYNVIFGGFKRFSLGYYGVLFCIDNGLWNFCVYELKDWNLFVYVHNDVFLECLVISADLGLQWLWFEMHTWGIHFNR